MNPSAAFACKGVHRVVVKGTFAQLYTAVAADAAADGLVSDPKDLAVNAFFLQCMGDLRQGCVGAAVLVGRSVDQYDFHRCASLSNSVNDRLCVLVNFVCICV